MADKIYLKSFFGYREDTLENWLFHNPILEKGEPSIVRDSEDGNWLKIGDGVTWWVNLPYKKGPQGIPGPAGAPGPAGDDYILTEADKKEIANMAKPEIDQTYNPESENAQSGVAVAEAISFNLLYSTEITQEAFDEAGEEGITLITLGDSNIDLTPYNEILVHITVPDSSAINTEANMLYIYVTGDSSYSASDRNVWLRPQSLGIAENCQLNTTYNKFAISGFWHNDSFLYGIIARNGYRGSLGYASGVDGWTEVADNFFKSEKHYFHIFGDEKTFKFPVGTKVIVYGR